MKKIFTFFTLVELLVVIAILTILASLLQLSLKKTLEHASEVKCSNNLKQNMSAMEMAILDGVDGIPPGAYIPKYVFAAGPKNVNWFNDKHWPGILSNYLGSSYNKGVGSTFVVPESYICPEDKTVNTSGNNIRNDISYATNGGIYWQYAEKNRFTFAHRVPNPASLVIFADSDRNDSFDYSMMHVGHLNAGTYPGFVHQNRAISVFADMHVEKLYGYELWKTLGDLGTEL